MEDKVILYHQKGCPQCMMVETLLKKYNISYESCMDVDAMVSKGIQHTPVIELSNGELLDKKPMLDWVNSHRG